jgi:hypothetical protein
MHGMYSVERPPNILHIAMGNGPLTMRICGTREMLGSSVRRLWRKETLVTS